MPPRALCAALALAALVTAVTGGDSGAASSRTIAILCYHDISAGESSRRDTVTPETLRAHIRDARAAGWTFVPLSAVIGARYPEELPEKTMVLTFDDAYRSFLTDALPILREEGIKATVAIITASADDPGTGPPRCMSWDEIRDAEKTGLVEMASHTHKLHAYEPSNPWGDTGPSVTTWRYLAGQKRYESREEYRRRIRDDLLASQARFREQLGHEVPVLVWPYGEYNDMARELAAEAGFRVTLGLGSRPVEQRDFDARVLPRTLVLRDMAVPGRDPIGWIRAPEWPIRAAQVDLDAVYDADPAVLRERVELLRARLLSIGATHVFLQACPDLQGDGFLERTYFYNHQAKVRSDVWSMVASKIAHAGLKVWIRAPSMNLSWQWQEHHHWRVPVPQPIHARDGGPAPWYFRISPDLQETHRAARDFYTDIAVYLPIDGVLFDDDAFMLGHETLQGNGSADPAEKAAAIRGLLQDVKRAVWAWRPGCRFGRNLYAPVLEADGVHAGFAQDFAQSIRDDDLTVVMAYSRMEGHQEDAEEWISGLGARALRIAGTNGSAPTVMFKFQTVDWRSGEWIPASELVAEARAAAHAGIVHLGVYPVSPDEGDLPPGLLVDSGAGTGATRPRAP